MTAGALVRLGTSTAEAVSGVLELFAPGRVSAGDVAVVAADRDPLDGVSAPAVATSVSYVDGVTGGNVFVMTVEGARKLAAAMMGMDPDAIEPGEELGEDRKSTRLNSSHANISYAVFCLKKKNERHADLAADHGT